MTSERSVRDRLAEALFDNYANEMFAWSDDPPTRRRKWLRIAGRLLSALPSVGLSISTKEEGGAV